MPAVEGVDIGPGKDLPKTVIGKPRPDPGINITMFMMPVPREQSEKLQGTLGFSQKIQGSGEEEKQTAPSPAKDK